MKFKFKGGERIRTMIAPIATGTVIEAGDLVAMSSGLVIKAVAASTAIAYCPDGHEANSGTEVVITEGNDFTLVGTADAVFAAANRSTECDILDTTQYLNMDASSTKVLRIGASKDAGVVGVASGIEVRINIPLF
jgi:hypothetical protein